MLPTPGGASADDAGSLDDELMRPLSRYLAELIRIRKRHADLLFDGRYEGADGGAIGRRLDFLAQELNREANTLCSKSNDVELTNIGLELKSVVEQFREQVQNLE